MTTPTQSDPQEVPQWIKAAAEALIPFGMTADESREDGVARASAIMHRYALPALTAATEENERLKQELEQTRANLYAGLDRDKDDITTPHLATVAANTIHALQEQLSSANLECAHWKWNTQTWNVMAVELGKLAGVAENEVPWFDKAKAAINAMTYRHGIITEMAANELTLRSHLAQHKAWGDKAREELKRVIEFLEECETAEDRSNLEGDSADAVLEQINDEAEKDLPKLKALLATHPADSTCPKDGPGDAAEAYFIDRDLFMQYVNDHVQPARLKEGLAVLSERSCEVSYDIIKSGRYRAAMQSQQKAPDGEEGV